MILVLKRDWKVIDGSGNTLPTKRETIPAGRHEIERIPNPYGHGGAWLVLKGTRIGLSEAYWRKFTGSRFDDDEFQVVIEEDLAIS